VVLVVVETVDTTEVQRREHQILVVVPAAMDLQVEAA
jgi:hypothetical protein